MLEATMARRLRDFRLDVDLAVEDGEIHCLTGGNGAGKTTLLHIIAGLIVPDTGRISLNGRTLLDMDKRIDVPVEERRIGYVLQRAALFPHLTVRDNIAYGLAARRMPRSTVDDRVQSLIEQLNLGHIERFKASQLSGGQQQLVALGRAMAIDPQLLLLDEPFRALDQSVIGTVTRYISDLVDEQQIPCILVTHNMDDVESLRGQVSVMHRGTIAKKIENWYAGTITGIDQGEASIDVGGVTVTALTRLPAGTAVRVMFRAEDVTVSLDAPRNTSARNTFRGTITHLEEMPPFVQVEIDAGIPIAASITVRSARNLDLREGREVWASMKATAVRVAQSSSGNLR